MLPPPNITGNLHMGHAFQQTIIDIIIRYQRMQGKNTLYQVGTDHAGIATQLIVERKLSQIGKTRNDYNRHTFINEIWQWQSQAKNIIKNQMKRLGNSADWNSERFTMDKNFSQAVQEAFIHLYKDDLIYRGKRLVNWDPKLNTAISDLEIDNRESKGFMWYIRYPLLNDVKTIDGKKYLIIATTRPETLFGDSGIAVNPQDNRYQHLIGQQAVLPIVNRAIPIISDSYVSMTKGTGCVKVTPGHDFNDYQLAQRHHLLIINTFTFDGKLRKIAQIFDHLGNQAKIAADIIPLTFQNMERFQARKLIVATIMKLGLMDNIKSHNLVIPYSDRSEVIVEPMITNQWYVRTGKLAAVAMEAVHHGRIKFISKQYENMYFSWMRNIQDWCISRQLWWGHRIPAWYDSNGNVYVGHNELTIRKEKKIDRSITLDQDHDVLDTWFSSALWTFVTLGWPENSQKLSTFHPTDVLVSGFDIIFFWIARMIMLTMHLIKDPSGNAEVPFRYVYITGLIRDEEGKKMSKLKGNVIDPLDIIDGISLKNLIHKRISNLMEPRLADKIAKHTIKQFPNGIIPTGTDALRFTFAALSTSGRDIYWDMKRLEGYRNFCNKLWNASRFILLNTQNNLDYSCDNILHKSIADRWILATFNSTIKCYREALDNYRFDIAANILYDFTWNQFCDWYLEFSKPIIYRGKFQDRQSTQCTLINILESLLRLAHPIIPFITEAIWQRVKIIKGINADSIMLQNFPQYNLQLEDDSAIKSIKWVKKIINTIRIMRREENIPSNQLLDIKIKDHSITTKILIKDNYQSLIYLAKLNSITLLNQDDYFSEYVTRIINGTELLISTKGILDREIELHRIIKEITQINEEIEVVSNKLKNKNFVLYAKKSVVAREKERLNQLNQIKVKLLKKKKNFKI